MSAFVLIPGFWLGGWAWDRVAPGLRDAGHEAYPVTLPGMADPTAPDVDLDTDIAFVADLVERLAGPVVLVGHSYGGFVATGTADRVPERVERLVYVDSGPVPPGTSQAALTGTTVTGERIPVPDFDPAADPQNLAGLTERDLALMATRGVPQPAGTATQPVKADPARLRDLPTDLVSCVFDAASVERMIADGHPFMAQFAALADRRVHGLPTGHYPMFSRPDDLVALLASIVRA